MQAIQNIHLAFDVGHSSIGWAVLTQKPTISVLGTGSLIFTPNACLASKRREYRQQRRRIRSTRQRIERIKCLLLFLKVLSQKQIDASCTSSPWLLAAQVIQGKRKLSWQELWNVLRWYAHNRGYDGNSLWSSEDKEESKDQKENTEQIENAEKQMKKYRTSTMAETFCAMLGIDPKENKTASQERFKGQKITFPRKIVKDEVWKILQMHHGKLPRLNETFEKALMEQWDAIPCPDLKIPKRYKGGLLFGQLIPRLNNRILSYCPISYPSTKKGEKPIKTPLKACKEFLLYRWGMLLANISPPLKSQQRLEIDQVMHKRGKMSKKEFIETVRSITGHSKDNLEALFLHPDADEALVLDPVQAAINEEPLSSIWQYLPINLQKRWRGKLRNKKISLQAILEDKDFAKNPARKQAEEALKEYWNKKKKQQGSYEDFLNNQIKPKKMPEGRAPYARELLLKAYREIMAGKHPNEKGNCLYRSEEVLKKEQEKSIDQQTNNHLIRHRLLMLERLIQDIIQQYADGKPDRVQKIVIEVSTDLRSMASKTNEDQAKDLGARLADHKQAVDYILKHKDGKKTNLTAGLIRKVRIARDMDWTCPYTGRKYDLIHLIRQTVDKDHIVPRSQRMSDSLDSLVLTFKEINTRKGNQTALEFIRQENSRQATDIVSEQKYIKFVKDLKTRGAHPDDESRKKKRKKLMLVEKYEEKEFTPRDLTITSQLVRMGAQACKNIFKNNKKLPKIVSMPGSVTATIRKNWNLMGCLTQAVPQILQEDKTVRTKTEIRGITHLHHALDAVVLGLTSAYIGHDGKIWKLLVKRKFNKEEKEELKKNLPFVRFTKEGWLVFDELPQKLKKELSQKLCEKRVVQHVSRDMSGMAAEETVYRVLDFDDQHPSSLRLQQWLAKKKDFPPLAKTDDAVYLIGRKRRDANKKEKPSGLIRQTKDFWITCQKVSKSKLVGLESSTPDKKSKLRSLKAAKIIGDNFGLVLDPEPQVIPFHKVYAHLQTLKKSNGGKQPRVWRNGQVIHVPRAGKKSDYRGYWRIKSIKDGQRDGILLDLLRPEHVKSQSKVDYYKPGVRIDTLLEAGTELQEMPLTGSVQVS